jgi:hypothetical protein
VKSRYPAALAPALALAGLLVAPAAQAATVGSPAACVRVVPGLKTFPVVADGFPAGAFISFKADGSTVGSGQADAAGHFDNAADMFTPPFLPSGVNRKTFQLTADDGAGTVAGPVPLEVANVIVTAPSSSKPARRVRFRVFGFQSGKRVYLHVRRNGSTKGRFSLGKTSGACGLTSKRMRFMPVRNYSTGTYQYYFSHSRRFAKSRAIYVAKVRIFRTFSAASAQATAAGSWG